MTMIRRFGRITRAALGRVSAVATLITIATLSLAASGAAAQDYPHKPIRFIVPYGASGGGPDFLARAVGEKLRALSGQAVVVDNRAGAAGLLGTGVAAKAPADGYNVLVGDSGPLSIAPGLQKDLAFNPDKDFIPVTNGMTAPLFLVVNASLPANNVKELVAHLKANPNLPYGSTGIGSVHQLLMEKFLSMTGTKMTHIPYTSQAQSLPAILSGELAVLVIAYPNVRQHIAAGKLKALAVATRQRTPFAPNVPTIAESGVTDFEVGIDVGFLVPAGTPADIVQKLNAWIVEALKMPDIADKLVAAGLMPIPSTPAAYAAKIRNDRVKFKSIMDDIGLKP